jgi:hypothetical protein
MNTMILVLVIITLTTIGTVKNWTPYGPAGNVRFVKKIMGATSLITTIDNTEIAVVEGGCPHGTLDGKPSGHLMPEVGTIKFLGHEFSIVANDCPFCDVEYHIVKKQDDKS